MAELFPGRWVFLPLCFLHHIGFRENSYALASYHIFDAAAGLNLNEAGLKNRNLLQVANLPIIEPESIHSFEVDYKSVCNNKLVIDFDVYYNSCKGFLGQVEVAVPTSGKVGTDAAVPDMLTPSKQDRYRVCTNAKNVYNSYGPSLGIT